MIKTLFQLIMGHAVADFGLQSDVMAKMKNPFREHLGDYLPDGQKYDPLVPWMYLTAHALIHGAAVYVVTGLAWAAAVEVVTQWLIDLGKCHNLYGPSFDQCLHLVMKLMLVV